MAQKIRIKDIAMQAGVSVGTVDRILHNRPHVSEVARRKVEQVMQDIKYRPNAYASALAYNRSYTFYIIMPQHESEAYWQEVEEGALKACEVRGDFDIDVQIRYYRRFDTRSYAETFEAVIRQKPNGIVVVPSELEVTRPFTDLLHDMEIPFVMLDSYLPELQPLSYFGQDPISSGRFAARILMLIAGGEHEIMLMKQSKDGKVASAQQAHREVGFRQYMAEHHPDIAITEFLLSQDVAKNSIDRLLDQFFADHPDVHHCITLSARAHIISDYLLRHGRKDIHVMGYDMVSRNEAGLRQGAITFLIAQHAYMQGYYCIDTLFKSVVLKQDVRPVNFMPIELLTSENVDFYRRTQI